MTDSFSVSLTILKNDEFWTDLLGIQPWSHRHGTAVPMVSPNSLGMLHSRKQQRSRARAPAGCATRCCYRTTLLGHLWGLPPQDTAGSFCHSLKDKCCRTVPSFGETCLGSTDFTFGANLRTAIFPKVSIKSFQGCWSWIIQIGCLGSPGALERFS